MKFFEYAKGFVRMKLWGNGVERFFNLCAHKQLYLWDIESANKYIYANIRLRDFYRCKKLARKAGIRAVLVERHGLPFFIPKILNRAYFLVGICVFVLISVISANMLLRIQITGNLSVSKDMVMDFLKDQNIHYGMWMKDVPIEELEKKLRNEFNIFTWVTAKVDGTVLEINIKENEKPDVTGEFNRDEYGSSLFANVDGIVRDIYVRNGVPIVKTGMEVKTGDLLVDGKVPVYNQEQLLSYYQYYHADADIMIETTVPVRLELDSIYLQKEYTGRGNSGKYFSWNQKIYHNNIKRKQYPYKDIIYYPLHAINIGNISITFGDFLIKEYVMIEKKYSKKEATEILQKEFDKNNALLLEKGVQILAKDVTIDLIMGKWTLKGEMRVIMPAFIRKPNEIPEVLYDSEGI